MTPHQHGQQPETDWSTRVTSRHCLDCAVPSLQDRSHAIPLDGDHSGCGNMQTAQSSNMTKEKAFKVRSPALEIHHQLREWEVLLVRNLLQGFVPDEVIDIHTHLLRDSDFSDSNRPPFSRPGMVLGTEQLKRGWQTLLPSRKVRGLCFGLPARGIDRDEVNSWVEGEVRTEKDWKYLALAGPEDDPSAVGSRLSAGICSGLKVYHWFGSRLDSFDCGVTDFAPEWMWELLDHSKGILMLHIVRDAAMADPENQKAIRFLCRKYPGCKLVLAHVARSFSHRHALKGLSCLRDLDNVWVDTSAVCESQAMAAAIEILGPERVLFGSDYPVSNFRGRSSTIGSTFHWLYENSSPQSPDPLSDHLTLVGIESLLALREAADSTGLTVPDLERIFRLNALTLLDRKVSGPSLDWVDVRSHISCGTGLMSKRREQFDEVSWPTFFSRCHGANVWDQTGKRFVDFAGGVGAILLGYGDLDIERALRRRLSSGTYCTLVNPDEDLLARKLLELHPWAGRVRFARGGGEAMTMAVRIARAATGRSGIVFCGYHGWQDWYLAANLANDQSLDGHLLPGLQPLGVPRELRGTSAPFRYNDYASLENALAQLNGEPAAIVMEPMRSSFPENDFLSRVKALAASKGAVFVLDEVTSGLRFGFPGAHNRLGITPDLAVYAKAISNGFACAAVVGTEAVMDAALPSFISSSYWTEAMGTTAALTCLHKVEQLDASSCIWESGENFVKELKRVVSAHPACRLSVGGMPPCPSLVFGLPEHASAARSLMIRGLVGRGFLASSQLYLMLAHTEEQKKEFFGALDESLAEVDRAIIDGRVSDPASATGAIQFARLA
jgi:glutamate-1-semialdehyde 2,1-aminomutase